MAQSTARAVPFSRLLDARVAFIRALESQTEAIGELYRWRLPNQARQSDREQRLREFVAAGSDLSGFYTQRDGSIKEWRFSEMPGITGQAGHAPQRHFDTSWFGLAREHVDELAGSERAAAAIEWAQRYKLAESLWVRDWATFALLWWELCRYCTVPDCSRGCSAAAEGDVGRAISLVLSPEMLLTLENANGSDWTLSLSTTPGRGGTVLLGGGERMPLGFEPVQPLMGPHPLLETEQEFIARAKQAWNAVLEDLKRDGLQVIVPRKLELHCEWLVRRHVCGHTAAEILGSGDAELSTVYKATDSLGKMLGLQVADDVN